MIKIWIMIGMSLMASTVFAEACLIESNSGGYSNKSCIQNAGSSTEVFANVCAAAGVETPVITMLIDCPAKSVATCDVKLNGIEGKYVQHVYSSTLAQAYKLSCENNTAGKGIWKFN